MSVLGRLVVGLSVLHATAFALTLQAYFQEKEDMLFNARDRLEAEYSRIVLSGEGSSCSWDDSCAFSGGSQYGAWPGVTVDLTKDGVYFQPGQSLSTEETQSRQDLVCAADELGYQFIQNYADDPDLRWQYFGSQEYGFVSTWPYSDFCPAAGDYDPRFRPWYAQAASQPKDVVLILDTSGSMSAANRLNIAKRAAITVLDTLSFSDFFQVITFNDNAGLCGAGPWRSSSPNCGDMRLLRATSENKGNMTDYINSLNAGGQTNMGAAFELAYDILDATRSINGASSNCYQVALFLTDGMASGGTENPVDVVNRRRSSDNNLLIFTYSFGSEADKKIPKQLACENRGIWTPVPDNADLSSIMASYYVYFALGVPASEQAVGWSEPYTDAFGLGRLTTASIATYDTSKDPPEFFGVIGFDLPLSEVYAAGVTYDGHTVRNERDVYDLALELSTQTCGNLELNDEQLETLREPNTCSVNSIAVGIGLAVPLGVIIIVVVVAVLVCSKGGGHDDRGDLR